MKSNNSSISFVGSILLAAALTLFRSGSLRHATPLGPLYTIEDMGQTSSRLSLSEQRDGNSVRVISADKPYGEVGWMRAQGRNTSHAFLLHNGQLEDLGTLGGNSSYAWDLNAYGWVVGYSQTPDRSRHAFLFQGSLMADLGTLGGEDSRAYGVNDQGQIVGYADTDRGERHAFLYDQGRLSDLGTLGGLDSVAYSINNKGQVVGSALPLHADRHAVLWQQGAMYDLNRQIPSDLGWELVEVSRIDDQVRIWGNGLLRGLWRRFVLTPR